MLLHHLPTNLANQWQQKAQNLARIRDNQREYNLLFTYNAYISPSIAPFARTPG